MGNLNNREDLFSTLPELEQEHLVLLNDNIFEHYMTYRHVDRGLDDSGFVELPAGTVCACSHCKEETYVLKKPENKNFLKSLKHNEETVCPICKQKVTAKADGRGRKNICDRYRLVIFIPVNFNTVWVRCYDWLFTDYTDIFEPHEWYSECERVLFTPDDAFHWELRVDYTEYITGKQGDYWQLLNKPHEPFSNKGSFFNPGGYECVGLESVDETFLKYSACYDYLDTRYNIGEAASLIKYLEYYCKYPSLEYIEKAGFTQLAASLVEYGKKGRNCLNWKAKKFNEFFKLGKADINALSAINPDSDKTAEYITFTRKHPEMSGTVEKLYYVLGTRGTVEDINQILNALGCPVKKLFNYLIKTKTPANDYLDYVRQCVKLDYSINDERVMFPKNFQEAHNLATKASRVIADKETNEMIKKRKRLLTKFIFENERFIIIIPESAGEIIDEGETLDHCVGRYAEDHANGETNILFLRYKRKPDKPFYTIEMNDDGAVCQCRGKENCDQTKKVEAFVEEFEKFAKKAAKRKNVKKSKEKSNCVK